MSGEGWETTASGSEVAPSPAETGPESQDPGDYRRPQRTVLWIGSSAPDGRLEPRLAERHLSLRTVSWAELGGAVTDGSEPVLCFGPGASARQVTSALEALAPPAPGAERVTVVLGAAGDLGDFQELIDGDRLFHLSAGRLPERDLVALLAAAAEALEGRRRVSRRTGSASLPLDGRLGAERLRRLALARSPRELASAAGERQPEPEHGPEPHSPPGLRHEEPAEASDGGAPSGPFRKKALRELERPAGPGAPPLLAAVTRRRVRIRYVPQTSVADCGAACLAMTLGWHGKTVALDDVRKVTGSGRHGLDANTLIRAAEHFGLRGRGVQLREPEDLALLDPGSILHWGFYHFVVLERVRRGGAWILDPGGGRRFVRREELDRTLTGVALVFEPGPELERGGERRPLLRRYLGRVLRHKASLGPVLAFSLLIQICSLAVPVLTGVVVDRVIPHGNHHLFWVLLSGAAAFSVFAQAVNLLRARTLLVLRTRLDAQLSSDFLEHLVRLPFVFFQQRSTGDLLMRLASNATIRETLTSSVLSGALDGLMIVSYLVLLLVADLRLGLLAAALAALRILILVSAVRRRRQLTAETLEAQAATQGYQVQLVAGIEALKASGAERRAVDTWTHLFTRELNTSLARGRLDALVNSGLAALALASPLAILLVGAARVMSGDLTLGVMLSIAALAGGFLAPLSTLVGNAAQFQLLGSYLERLDDVFSTPAEPDGLEWPRPEVFSGRVTLEDVSFRYGPLVPPALEGLSFEAAPGELVAVAGPSGSGKSTLAGLVAGLLEPAVGRVLYDGRPLAELPRDWLRSHLAYVPQQPFLFGTSIRANIALQDPSLPFERIVEAARLAEIHDEIEALPMGYETLLADGGTSLSGGQRQRIALARALVGRPRVLILDEATSALDAVTEQKVQRNLAGLDLTRIVAAHRLSTIRDANRILVLDRGRVADSGTHAELVARPGLYKELAEAQLEGGEPLAAGPRSRRTAEVPR